MIIGLIGLNTIVLAEDISYWVSTGYNSNLTRFVHTCDDTSDTCQLISSIAAASKSDSGVYGGISVEYPTSTNTTVGAHLSFTGNSSRFGFSNAMRTVINPNSAEYAQDIIVQQSTSPTFGIFSSYELNNISFSLGLDLNRIYLTEALSFATQYSSFQNFESKVIYNPKITITTATQLSGYKIGLSAYWGPSSTISQNEADPMSSGVSIGESGVKVTISHSLMPLLQSL